MTMKTRKKQQGVLATAVELGLATDPAAHASAPAPACPDCGIPWLVHGYNCGDRLAPDEVDLEHEEILAKRVASCCRLPDPLPPPSWPAKGDRVHGVTSRGEVITGTCAYARGEQVLIETPESLWLGQRDDCHRTAEAALAAANEKLRKLLTREARG